MVRKPKTLIADLAFGESPRWRNNRLYLSDIHANRVVAYRPSGEIEEVARFEGPVSGLGWLPDGRMLVVSMHDRRVLRQEPDGRFVEHADLSSIATWHANEMAVAADGEAYVGNFGFSLEEPINPQSIKMAKLARISVDGRVQAVDEELFFPNGTVITPDGKTLIVAESGAARLTAFDRNTDGSLSGRKIWANLPGGTVPDGICLDAEGAIWVAGLSARAVFRIREGGEVVDSIPTEQEAVACMLGGADRRTLFICTADTSDPAICRASHTAHLLAIQVDIPGAGFP